VQAAVTRTLWEPGLPDQRQTLAEALASYTRDSAYTEFMEGRKGELKPGQFADLVMLDGDITAVAPETIAAMRPAMTVCGGRVTYES
jgi:predicted amidohydrolase YtcJ